MPRGIRPRANCPYCRRSIAVTFNKRTGEAYLRPHVILPGEPCPKSSQAVAASRIEKPPLAGVVMGKQQ